MLQSEFAGRFLAASCSDSISFRRIVAICCYNDPACAFVWLKCFDAGGADCRSHRDFLGRNLFRERQRYGRTGLDALSQDDARGNLGVAPDHGSTRGIVIADDLGRFLWVSRSPVGADSEVCLAAAIFSNIDPVSVRLAVCRYGAE